LPGFVHSRIAMSRIAVLAAGSGALAVVLGAFGAHTLHDALDAAALQTWHTAAEYQFWHTLALLAGALSPPSRWRTVCAVAFALGIVAFCGSLYGLALGAPRGLGAITPLGGASLIVGWIGLGASFSRRSMTP
jgi:uncharacterized membrane protein YgdD (TMEM256/DUF423 family)